MANITNYNGYQLHIGEIKLNPNGKQSQTVLIYKDGQPVGGSYADVQFEDAVKKAKAKIDSGHYNR